MCMFRITNLEEINQKYCRELGNKVVTKVALYIQENISKEYIFVRYMGPKFVIAFSGVEIEDVARFLNDIKQQIEELVISMDDENEAEEDSEKEEKANKKAKTKKKVVMETTPKLNFVISTYYKGTGIEELLKRLEQYLDNASKDENEINNI